MALTRGEELYTETLGVLAGLPRWKSRQKSFLESVVT